MINVKELRIGNIIIANGLHEGCQMTVEQIGGKGTLHEDKRVIMFKEHLAGEFIGDCEGVPLTPKILESCGFVQSLEFDHWYLIDAKISIQFDAFWWWSVDDVGDNEGSHLREVKYLHQLQNIHFALTGKELIIIK